MSIDIVLGENFMPAFSSTGEKMLDLFFKLVRNHTEDSIIKDIEDIFKQTASRTELSSDFIETLVNIIVLSFSTRDCRGGKGERKLFYFMILELYKIHAPCTLAIIKYIPHFGYFKDYFRLIEMIASHKEEFVYEDLVQLIIKLAAEQLKKDYDNIDFGRSKLSMAAKYFPREGKEFHKNYPKHFKLVVNSVNELIPPTNNNSSKQNYRRILSSLNEILDVPETYMCSKRFASIAFDQVPSVCMHKNKKAFLNEKLNTPVTSSQMETGNRYPYDYDRIQARKIFIDILKSSDKKINAGQLFPHEITKKCYNVVNNDINSILYTKQWSSLKENLISQINNYTTSTGKKPFISFENLVPLVDVSGSMHGDPMDVAIALGILISELNHPVFADSFITFHSKPTWFKFDHNDNIISKVKKALRAPWGNSTNFEAAIDLIIDRAKKNKLKQEEIPDLIVFSDMQFDAASGRKSMSTISYLMKNKFHKLGLDICNMPYKPPRIIYWNLRSSVGFPAQSGDSNITLLSGYSPSLFKFILLGDKNNEKSNPMDGLLKVLGDPRYFNIRSTISKESEVIFGNPNAYKFIPPEIKDNNKIEVEN